ncbi:TIGR01777 family protein [Parapedobacter sp. SGR-10]|uniref:TIGR01777 family oxidoreductase n=1 Tax=Parapedobacter sp. SGR-10 TaxID=2710879 RepID=UPI0013D3331E|nr:TIGR01777 family oxidoreductase [Parapedobacter sp. SGR-10]NGF58241.1 TIGR01777 family protein [Parapedobacter sp. SGR-10]
MERKIVIAGASGFVGKYLTKRFLASRYQVVSIARSNGGIPWNDSRKIIEALENSEMLINLAGKSVNCRYNKLNKAEILSSRTETTRILGEALSHCSNPPEIWINASTATIYRNAEDRAMTESHGEIGTGFSVEVAKLWEKTFFGFELPDTRQVALRITIVLGLDGGVMTPFKNLVRFGLGGKQGNGKQMFSWIHIEDLYRIILYIQSHKHLSGVFNCAAPTPVDNRTLMQTFRRLMHVTIGLPFSAWLLELGAVVIRTETELLLKSRWVIPKRLSNEGFVFKFPTLETALTDILSHE